VAYYAFLDDNNIVTEVITGIDETELIEGKSPEDWYGEFRGKKCVRTSYNTFGGVHTLGGEPLYKNYAGIGYSWDGTGFAAPQPYPSWSLDLFSYQWQAPVAEPEEGKRYTWDEPTTSWVEVTL
jgi:hypothetical protein